MPLYGPWCRHLDSLPNVKPQINADNLKCSAERPGALFDSARFAAQYVRSVGQDVSPGKCVLLSTSKSVRKALKLWDVSGSGGFSKVHSSVGASPGPRFHFPDRDPVHERPAKRCRITGESSVVKRAVVASGDLPTPKRWKRLAPQSSGRLMATYPFSSHRSWSTSLSDARDLSLQDKASDAFRVVR